MKEKALVVDDSPGLRRLVGEILTNAGIDVVTCGDGQEALKLYEHTAPTWVVMDVRMKSNDGFAATRQLVTRFPGARVVLMSAFEVNEFWESAVAAGAAGCIGKDDLSGLPALLRRL
jgi:two-component system, chemotaxis family, chemotaxis protein CheY